MPIYGPLDVFTIPIRNTKQKMCLIGCYDICFLLNLCASDNNLNRHTTILIYICNTILRTRLILSIYSSWKTLKHCLRMVSSLSYHCSGRYTMIKTNSFKKVNQFISVSFAKRSFVAFLIIFHKIKYMK